MARVKGIAVSNLEGRIGNVVFRNRQGVNVASQRPATVKNPQTDPQQYQRMKFNTLVQAYSTLKEICDHSFEGITYGAKSQAYFMKQNNYLLSNLPSSADISYVFKGNAAFIPNHYMVSKGSLESPALRQSEYHALDGDWFKDNAALVSDVTDATPMADITYAQLRELLGVERGEQLTILAVEATSTVSIHNTTLLQPAKTKLHIIRMVFSETAADDVKAFKSIDGGFYPDTAILAESQLSRSFIFNKENSVFRILGPATDGETVCIAMCAIRSRKDGQKWLRSTEYFNVDLKTIMGDENHDKNGSKAEIAVRTYNPTDPYYLNNATV